MFRTLVCVWQLRKIWSTENHLRFDWKISHFERKIIYALILPSNNFQKSHLKKESSSTLFTQSKTHIQAHLSQAPASLDRATPRSKTHLQAYLQTISKKKKHQEQEERVEPLRSRAQPQIAPPHPTLNRTSLVAPQHRRDHTHDQPMPDLSLSRSTSPFPSIVDHSLFLPLSLFHRIFEFNECFVLIFVSFKFI